MALSATIYKAQLSISDMGRHHYAEHPLTLARHPSETDERLMVRLLAFALYADEQLAFTKGLCVDEEPELWQKGLSGEIELWVEVGLPDEKRLRKACGRAQQVVLFCYGGNAAQLWWQRQASALERCRNLHVFNLPEEATRALAAIAARNMQLQVTIQDGHVWLDDGTQTLEVVPQVWKG